MKQFKNLFGITGPATLLKAFHEEAIAMGWEFQGEKIGPQDDKLFFNGTIPAVDLGDLKEGHFWTCSSYGGERTSFSLPHEWGKALEYAAEERRENISNR